MQARACTLHCLLRAMQQAHLQIASLKASISTKSGKSGRMSSMRTAPPAASSSAVTPRMRSGCAQKRWGGGYGIRVDDRRLRDMGNDSSDITPLQYSGYKPSEQGGTGAAAVETPCAMGATAVWMHAAQLSSPPAHCSPACVHRAYLGRAAVLYHVPGDGQPELAAEGLVPRGLPRNACCKL